MEDLSDKFEKIFGHRPRFRGRAHGQMVLLGHEGGNLTRALVKSVPQKTECRLQPRGDHFVWLSAIGGEPPQAVPVEVFKLGEETHSGRWVDLVEEVTMGLREVGCAHEGFDLLADSDIPLSSGLSSGVALQVALLRALREAFELRLEDEEIGRIAAKLERRFFPGETKGLIETLSTALADPDTVLLIDQEKEAVSKLNWPGEAMELFALYFEGLPVWERLSIDPDKESRRLSDEDQRVSESAVALESANPTRFGELLTESHLARLDVLSTPVPELEELVQCALEPSQVYGARILGGIRGGTLCFVSSPGAGSELANRILRACLERTGYDGRILMPTQDEQIRAFGNKAPPLQPRSNEWPRGRPPGSGVRQ